MNILLEVFLEQLIESSVPKLERLMSPNNNNVWAPDYF